MLTLRKYEVLERAEKAGIKTSKELAERLGVTPTWLSACLQGRRTPSTDMLVALVQVLGCDIDDIATYPKDLAPVMA